MGKHSREGRVQVIDGKKDPLCRKTACYKVTLFIVAVLLASLIISCVIIVVLRGELVETEKVTVKVGHLELRVKKHIHDVLMNYFNKVDTEKNGTISLQAAHAYFDTLDDDKDGIVRSEDVKDNLGPEYEFIFQAEDFDDDELLYRRDVGIVHQRVDIDDDGFVSRDEFALFHDLARRAVQDRGAL